MTPSRAGRTAAWWAVLGAVLLGVLIGTASPAARAGQATAPEIIGFQQDSSPVRAINRSAAALSTVDVDGVNLVPAGNAVPAPTAADLAQLAVAHGDHLRGDLVVGNWSDAIGDFSEPLAHRLLGDPAAIAALVAQLAPIVAADGWDGINFDMESLAARDATGLTRLVAAMRAALPATDTVSLDVESFTHAGSYPANGYDLRALAASANELVLMAYDEHGPWANTPGPIGALGWTKASLRAMQRSVPAAQVDLGVAGYGYAWRPHRNVTLSDAGARRLAAAGHGSPHFVAAIGEWTATLADGSTLWWSDHRSLVLKAAVARADHLHGLAVWSLGQSDPITSPW